MPKSKVYEKRNVLPGGGGNNSFIKPQTQADTLPQQPQPSAQVFPNENMRINSVPPKDPDSLPLNTPQSVNTQPQRTYNPQSPEETISQQPQNDKPMQPVKRANYWSPSATPASFSSFTPTPPKSPTSTYTPSSSDPTQSVMDFMLAPSKEEQKMYRDNESKKRLLLLTDALRHISNIYNTTRGATPQQFTSPVVQQEQLYQQKKNELRGQRQLALNNAMDQAKLNADLSYKNSMLGMRQAELDRGLANDRFNQQLNLGKFAYNQEKDKNDWALKLAAQQEAARHNKTSEALRRQGNAISAMNARTAQQSLAFKMGENGGLPKGYVSIPHYENAKGGTTSWVVNEKKYKEYLPVIYKDLVNKGVIKPITSGDLVLNFGGTWQGTNEDKFKKMDELVKSAYWSKGYTDWMERIGAVRSDGKDVKVTTTKKLNQRRQAEAKPKAAPKPQTKSKQKSIGDKYSKYER